jgi:hypothetical protein
MKGALGNQGLSTRYTDFNLTCQIGRIDRIGLYNAPQVLLISRKTLRLSNNQPT